MRIELTGKVKLKNRLVNSISILDDSIYYSSSLMNSISKLNLSTLDDEVVVGEGCGYGRYKFREPVHVKAIKEGEKVCLLVSDWHNHRLLKYSNNKYITELGFFASTSSKIYLRPLARKFQPVLMPNGSAWLWSTRKFKRVFTS